MIKFFSCLPCDNCHAFEGFLKLRLIVTALLLNLGLEVIHVGEYRVLTDDLEADVDVQKHTSLLHDESRVKPWPHLDLVSIQAVSFGGVERLAADGFKSESAHHRVEEDLQEVEVVAVSLLHQLHPLNGDLVLGAIMLSLEHRDISGLLE